MNELGPGESLTPGGYLRLADGSVLVPEETVTFIHAVEALGDDLGGKSMSDLASALGNCDPVPAVLWPEENLYLHEWSRPGYSLKALFNSENTVCRWRQELGGQDTPWVEEQREAQAQAELQRAQAEIEGKIEAVNALPPWRRADYAKEIGLNEAYLQESRKVAGSREAARRQLARSRELDRQLEELRAGHVPPPPDANPQMVCPHCNVRGYVRTSRVKRKAGVSGAKVTGALLTGGVSVLATGFSRKETVTEAHCVSCGTTWHFE